MERHDEILKRITRTLIDRFNPYRIVLFGSRARDAAAEDSDFDIFVEMDSDKPPHARASEISLALTPRRWGLDVFVYTPEEVRKWKGVRGTLLRIVELEGRVLYERPAAGDR